MEENTGRKLMFTSCDDGHKDRDIQIIARDRHARKLSKEPQTCIIKAKNKKNKNSRLGRVEIVCVAYSVDQQYCPNTTSTIIDVFIVRPQFQSVLISTNSTIPCFYQCFIATCRL